MCKLGVSIRRSGGGSQSEGAEGRYYPWGSMGALCHGHAGGEGQGGEQRPVIMLVKTQCRNQTDYTIVYSHVSEPIFQYLKCPISATGPEFVLDLSKVIHYWPICDGSNDFFSVF